MASRPPETRPYRIAVYVVFIGFQLLWIGLVARSVALDLWGGAPAAGAAAPAGLGNCAAELEALARRIDARSTAAMHLTPAAGRDWDSFTREFENRLEQVKSRCESVGDAKTRAAAASLVDKLDTLRLHLSRCGEQGEEERKGVYEGLKELQQAMRQSMLK